MFVFLLFQLLLEFLLRCVVHIDHTCWARYCSLSLFSNFLHLLNLIFDQVLNLLGFLHQFLSLMHRFGIVPVVRIVIWCGLPLLIQKSIIIFKDFAFVLSRANLPLPFWRIIFRFDRFFWRTSQAFIKKLNIWIRNVGILTYMIEVISHLILLFIITEWITKLYTGSPFPPELEGWGASSLTCFQIFIFLTQGSHRPIWIVVMM